jgi:hypothetical protein
MTFPMSIYSVHEPLEARSTVELAPVQYQQNLIMLLEARREKGGGIAEEVGMVFILS